MTDPRHREPPGIMYLIKQLELVVRSRLDDAVRPWGVTAPQYTALTVLARRSGMTSADLARHSFVTAQAMSEMVAALTARGLIERTSDPAHRRRLRISLTPAGQQLLADCRPDVEALEARMLVELDQGERAQLHHVLQSCRRSLAAEVADA